VHIDIRHSPSFACARVNLDGGERVKVETGAMMAHTAGMQLSAGADGGVFKAFKRGMLGGESFFVSTFTAPPGGGWVDVAPALPGDVFVAHLDHGDVLNITKGSWLCSSHSVDVDTKFAGFRSMFGGEGAFLARATGPGDIVLSCYGALDVLSLTSGERLIVDSGHLVGYEPTVSVQLKTATSGMFATAKSGEGLVFEFTGPGDVLIQSRNPGVLGAVTHQPGARQ
jgi:uncharacterized protein (TIGR00266 family)